MPSLTFEDDLAVQNVSGDDHRVEVLGETRSAGGFEGLARLTPLGRETRRAVERSAN